jgi:hypothetical protein
MTGEDQAARIRDADPIKRDPSTKKAELDAARDRAELAMAKDVTQFRHPNDLVTLAVAELGSPAEKDNVEGSRGNRL